MAEALWYYEENGKQAGPVSGAAIEEAIRSGRIAPGTRVWRAGLAGWLPWDTLPELAALARPPAPPPAPAPTPWSQPGAAPPPPVPPAGPAPGSPGWSSPAAAGGPLQPVGVVPTILLSVVTFSIYGIYRFRQCAKAYERLAGVARSRFDAPFWAHVGLMVAAIATVWLKPLSIALAVGSTVAGYFALTACLEARDAVVRSAGVRADLLPAKTHRLVWVGAKLVSAIPSMALAFLGLLGVVFQAVRFFDDHDKLAAALGGRAPPAGR